MKNKNAFFYLLTAITSAIVALLFAPNSGKVTRKKLQFQAEDIKNSINTAKDNLILDFKSSYFEAVSEVDKEYELLNERQEQLKQSISSIESELNS